MRVRCSRLLLTVGSAALVVSSLPGLAQAAPSTKYFTATVAPANTLGSSDVALKLTVTNSNLSKQDLGSADIDVPVQFALRGSSVVPTTGSAGWTAAKDGSVVELRSAVGIQPGQSVTVELDVTTPAVASPTSFTLPVTAKQSNDFQGTGNDFFFTGTQPTVTVNPLHLVFTSQPATTQVNTPMTAAVAVSAVDGNGATVSAFHDTVTLSLTGGSTGAQFSTPSGSTGQLSADAVDGVATFTGVAVDTVGFGYALTAADGALQAVSSPFDVVSVLKLCTANSACSAQITQPGSFTSGQVDADSATTSSQLVLSIGGNVALLLGCTSGTIHSAPLTFSVDRPKTVTMIIGKTLVDQVPNNGAAPYDVCYGTPMGPFVTKAGTPSAAQNPLNSNEWEGVLPDCKQGQPAPCVLSRTKKNGDLYLKVLAPAGDPRMLF